MEDTLQKLDLCAKFLIVQAIEANAETLEYTVEGFHKGEVRHGDWVVSVKKISTTPPKEA